MARPFVPSGTVIPLVTCIMPCPQSNEISAGPMPPQGASRVVWVVELSIQLIDLRRIGGMTGSTLLRVPLRPFSSRGRPKKLSPGAVML